MVLYAFFDICTLSVHILIPSIRISLLSCRYPVQVRAGLQRSQLSVAGQNLCICLPPPFVASSVPKDWSVLPKSVAMYKYGVVKDDGRTIKPAQLDSYDLPEIINGLCCGEKALQLLLHLCQDFQELA